MLVKLLAMTPDPELLVAQAAKLCYSPVGVEEIEQGLTGESVESFLKMLVSMGHMSPMEHVSFTFAVEGISRTCTHQLVRHRIASYSQQSQRYVRLNQFQYIVPPAIAEDEEAKKIFLETMEADQRAYDALTERLIEKHSKVYMDGGMSRENARKKAEKESIEDARYVFPNACETKIVLTMNLRTLLHFFSLRCCNRAQWEIRSMATEMLRICKEVSPTLFKGGGPGCVRGVCPEGKMSCGKAGEVRKFFTEL